MVFRPDLRRTLFAIYSAGRWTLQDAIDLGPDARLVPFSANNNLIKNEVVLLSSEPRIYGSEASSWRTYVLSFTGTWISASRSKTSSFGGRCLRFMAPVGWTLQDAIDLGPDARLVPFSANNNLIKNEVVLLPREPRIYGSEAQLVADIRSFIHRYVDFGESFENAATHYVLLTWLYDAFNELPYLRLRGDYGSGKTRALLTIGSLCYKGFFASGASTVSPIFHTLDAFRGTLIFDEADFRFSDERAEIVKILNNGNVRGLPVLRTMMNRQREFNPQAFQVFGPKIVATRGWKVPGVLDWPTGVYNPRVDLTRDTTTLYASDRDVFLFLVDDLNPIEAGRLPDGSPDVFFRGLSLPFRDILGLQRAGAAGLVLDQHDPVAVPDAF